MNLDSGQESELNEKAVNSVIQYLEKPTEKTVIHATFLADLYTLENSIHEELTSNAQYVGYKDGLNSPNISEYFHSLTCSLPSPSTLEKTNLGGWNNSVRKPYLISTEKLPTSNKRDVDEALDRFLPDESISYRGISEITKEQELYLEVPRITSSVPEPRNIEDIADRSNTR